MPSIYVTCMGLFREHILRNPQYNIGKALNTVILDQIKMERDGDIIDHATIRSCVYMLEALYETSDENENERVYLTSFESKLPSPCYALNSTKSPYRGIPQCV